MSANELLMEVLLKSSQAARMTNQLVVRSAESDGLSVRECLNVINELDDALRAASCAATALRSLAVGNEEPKRG